MDSSHGTAADQSHPTEWQELRGHAQHQTVEVLRLILILLQDAVILVVGFGAEFIYEHWLHSTEPFFQLAIRLSSAFFLLLYVITVSVHIVQYIRGQIGATKVTRLGEYLPWAIIAGGVIAAAVALTLPGFHREGAATEPQQVMRAVIPLGPEERISANDQAPLAISPDGSHLVYVAQKGSQSPQLYVRSMDSLEDRAIPGTENGLSPFFSPDGQWIGFSWRAPPDGNKMMAVPVKTQPTFELGKPQLLFEAPYLQNSTGGGALYDVSRDGQRFLMLKPVASEAAAATQITVVRNWFEELKQKVPVK